MKKFVGLIGIAILLFSASVTVLAGSVPEDLLHSDSAQIFFGEVIDYAPGATVPHVSVCPVKKIKGDINTGTKQVYENANAVGDIDIKPGNVYLFTYYDEYNPTDIFEVTSYDTETLKLNGVVGDMWERFEKYLNDGEYEKAEQERVDKINAALRDGGEEISLTDLLEAEKDNCDKIEFGIFGRQEKYEIDKEIFFEMADEIHLTDVTNTLILNTNGFVISAYAGDAIHTVTMWDKCMVENSQKATYSAPMGDYAIKAADYKKLIALFPEEAQHNLPKMKNPYANFVYWAMDHPTLAFAVGILILIVLAGGIGFVIGYKIRKKKARR